MKADDPKLPEAGTFVAQDGDAHKPSKGVDALQEHVPFPKPSAEEMGIDKPSTRMNGGANKPQRFSKLVESLRQRHAGTAEADDPKLPEAGTFVAPNGDAHKPSEGVDKLQEHVPFPTPSAKEMGIEKPSTDMWSAGPSPVPSEKAETLKADDPKLPEAGTFVAQDGDAHKPSEGVDKLEEHVPFPKPSAEEMGIKKPTET